MSFFNENITKTGMKYLKKSIKIKPFFKAVKVNATLKSVAFNLKNIIF